MQLFDILLLLFLNLIQQLPDFNGKNRTVYYFMGYLEKAGNEGQSTSIVTLRFMTCLGILIRNGEIH